MLRFLGQFQADFLLTNGWIEPLLVGGYAPFSPIILDDFGLQPMDTNTRLALLQILEERYERKSMIIASQLPISKWYDYIGDPTLADAIMDRLIANANKIELKGYEKKIVM